MKILYCIVGMGLYGVLEGDVLKQDGLIISARRVFSVEVSPQAIKTISSSRDGIMNFVILTYEDVIMNCTFISNMSEKASFYQEIMKIVEKETHV